MPWGGRLIYPPSTIYNFFLNFRLTCSTEALLNMAPKKAVASSPPWVRRSTRVTSQSSTIAATKKTAPVKESTPSKKRAKVEENGDTAPSAAETPSAKKTKTILGVGDKLPAVILKDENGKEIKIVNLATEKGVVLFAYPKADTPGCTKQVIYPIDSTQLILGQSIQF
jgi:hypothetical protein